MCEIKAGLHFKEHSYGRIRPANVLFTNVHAHVGNSVQHSVQCGHRHAQNKADKSVSHDTAVSLVIVCDGRSLFDMNSTKTIPVAETALLH